MRETPISNLDARDELLKRADELDALATRAASPAAATALRATAEVERRLAGALLRAAYDPGSPAS